MRSTKWLLCGGEYVLYVTIKLNINTVTVTFGDYSTPNVP